MESVPDDLQSLQRHTRDLSALLALPATWHGWEPADIVGSLVGVMVSRLGLDHTYVRFDDPDDGPPIEVWWPEAQAQSGEFALAVIALSRDTPTLAGAAPTTVGRETIRITRTSPEFSPERGLVLASSQRIGFPTQLEQTWLQTAVDQAAISIHGARLLAREQASRAAAEAAHHRLTLLAEAGTRLVTPLNYEHTLQSVADLAVPTLADACIVDLVPADDSLHHVVVAHMDVGKRALLYELCRRYPAHKYDLHPIAHVLRTGRPRLIPEIPDGLFAHVAGDDSEHLQLRRSLGATSMISVPLVARRRTLGVMTCYIMESARRYGPADLALAEELARQAALAIDNTRLFRETQEWLTREQALRTAAEKLAAQHQAILRQIADGVVITDEAGRITFVNEVARRRFGFETLGVTIADHALAYPPVRWDARPWAPEELPLARAVRGETVRGAEMHVCRPDGQEISMVVSATPLTAEEGTQFGAVMTIYDVSAQRTLERRKDEFFANVSHDLRTPLAAIVASIGVLLANEPADMPPSLHQMLMNSEQAAERMAELVDNLLDLSRMQAGRIQLRRVHCDLREPAHRVADGIAPLAQARGQVLDVAMPAERIVASVDVPRLEQVLMNLLSNAHKYGRDGGTIRLSLARRPGEVILSVADDGPGIAMADQDRIFERYYRSETEATRYKQGSGLGLPIARGLIELHGGRLWLESTPGAGATFWIALPIDETVK